MKDQKQVDETQDIRFVFNNFYEFLSNHFIIFIFIKSYYCFIKSALDVSNKLNTETGEASIKRETGQD